MKVPIEVAASSKFRYWVRFTSSCFRVLKKLSAWALS